MKIRKIIAALILPGLLLAGLIGGKLVGKTHSSEVKATDANATLVGVYSANDFNNTEFGGGYNNVLITYTGAAHGLTDDPIKSADVLDKIKINGTTLTESGWGVIPWAGQLWFKIIHPSTVVSGDVLEIESGLTLGDATFENGLHLKLNENSKWEVFVPEVAPNSTYSGIYSDSFNNTAKFDGYNQVLIVYDGVAHGLTGDITSQEVLNQISINGTPLTALAVTPWTDQLWFNIIYPSSVNEGDILEVQNGFTLGAAVLKGFKLRLNSSLKWEYVPDDYGTFTFADANGDSTVGFMFGINWTENDLPAGWETEGSKFTPVDENSGTFVEGVRVGTEIKKVGPYTYYIPVAGATTGTIATVKGTWSNGTAKFTVEPFTRQWNGEAWVMPVYDYGTITFSECNKDSQVGFMYAISTSTNDLPAGWETEGSKFTPVDENAGAFVNNERVGTEIKKIDANTYYIPISGASIGTIATVKGTWSNGSAKFTVESFTRQWNGTKWERLLNEYDVVSLADANLPDFTSGNINTEDAPGYGYTGDAAYLAKQKGIFGLTNDTGSFGFELNFKTTDTMSDWVEIRVGASGGWVTGHVLKYQFTNQWNDGVVIVSERIDDAVYNEHSKEVRSNIEGDTHTIEFGAVKVLGEENLYFVYFRNNGVYVVSEYWELAAAPRSTKVGIYAPDTCISLTNSINPPQNQITLDTSNSTSSALRLNTGTDILPPVRNWDEYFIPVEDGITLNFKSITKDKWNYFKKPYEDQLYLDLGELGVSPESGDILYIGGMFKLGHSVNDVLTAYKVNIADTYLEYDGNAWGEVSAERYAEILAHEKAEAKAELDAYVNAEVYDETNLAIVEDIVNTAKADIDNATLIEQVITLLENAKDQILAQAKTKQTIVEEAIMDSNDLLDEYLEKYDIVTTSDLSAVGGFVFRNKDAGGYASGGYEDTTTKYVTSAQNLDGNVIFQFNYESTDPSASEYGSQVFIRMRGTDSNCYRFEIANDMGEGHAGVGLCVFANDAATQRKTYDANFAANTSYKIECGSIDLADYARTLLFIRINGEVVLKEIVDSVAEQRAAIRIMDSYTTGDVTATLSPIETGTTKGNNNPSLLGRLILDETSTKANLSATLKANNLPENAVLFPMESGAFTINGQEVSSWRSVTNIKKVGEQKYKVDFDSSELADGAVVHIGGYFSFVDSDTGVKSGYRFFDAEFVYHEATDSWTQNVPTDRETLVYEAKETLNNYANLANYSAANQESITAIVNEYLGKIDAAETDQIAAVLAEALAKIDAIPTLLDEAKAAAKAELAAYRSADLYRDEEKAALNEILTAKYAEIDNAASQDEIDLIVAAGKAAIDELKTAEQRDAEDLAAKKKTAKAEVNALAGKLEMDRYSDENQSTLSNLTYKAIEDIDKATTEAEIDQIVAKYRADIIDVETKDGSKFNGETYTGGSEGGEQGGNQGGSEQSNEQELTIWQRIVQFFQNAFKKVVEFFNNLYEKLSASK